MTFEYYKKSGNFKKIIFCLTWVLGIELLILVADGETVKLVIAAALDSICLICTDLFTLVLEKVSKPLKKIIIHQY